MSDYPDGWNHQSELYKRLAAVVIESDVIWEQALSSVGFCLASIIAGHEEQEARMKAAVVLCGRLLAAAESGVMPEMAKRTLQ